MTFAPHERTKRIQVSAIDDSLDEGNESLTVELSNPTNAVLHATQFTITGTITDNDPTPTVSIADAAVVEGNNGTTQLVFTVTLSEVSGRTVSVHFATAAQSATANSDFVPQTSSVAITAGETVRTITIDVNGDLNLEPDETLTVMLSDPVNTILARATATGTILDDDTPSLSGFVYNDLNHNGVKDPQESGIAGVVITLTGTDSANNPVNLTQTTAADGSYRFANLLPGDYMVVETHPDTHMDGIDTPGDASMTMPANDQFAAHLDAGSRFENNNFGENGLKPEAINKTLLFASRRRG